MHLDNARPQKERAGSTLRELMGDLEGEGHNTALSDVSWAERYLW